MELEPEPELGSPPMAMDEEDEAVDVGSAASPKRPHSPTLVAGVAAKLPRWRSPAVASSSGPDESQQSLPSPMVTGSSAVRVAVDEAIWRLTYSMFSTIFDLSLQGPLIVSRVGEGPEAPSTGPWLGRGWWPGDKEMEEGVGGEEMEGSVGDWDEAWEWEDGEQEDAEAEDAQGGSAEGGRAEGGDADMEDLRAEEDGEESAVDGQSGGAQVEGVSLTTSFSEAGDAPLQWELACYALLILIHMPSLAAGTLRTRAALLSDVKMPVASLFSGAEPGPQSSAKRRVLGQRNFGLALQVIRRLAEQGPFSWSLRDVSFSPADLCLFFEQSKSKVRKVYLYRGQTPRYSAHLKGAKQMLLDPAEGRMLTEALTKVQAELVTAHGERWHEQWDELADGSGGFVSDAAAAAGKRRQAGRARGRPPDTLLQALQKSAHSRLLDELFELRSAKEALEARVAELEESEGPPGVLDPKLLHETATKLLGQLDAQVEAADATALFAGGDLEGLDEDQLATVKRATRVWHMKSDVLDAALEAQPELHAMLIESMQRSDPSKGRTQLDAKVRCCFVLINLIARSRWLKGEAESLLPWGLGVFLVANHAPPIAIEGLRAALPPCVVSYRELWAFLRALTELIELSYSTWWPGQRLVVASDNWQTERSWGRARIGQYAPQRIGP